MAKSTTQFLTNAGFLHAVSDSFNAFLTKGTSRSTDKLKPLHGAIAKDIANRLGADYEICSQGYRNGREASIIGRYTAKRVDITIKHNKESIAGIGVKFVMQNYAQNAINYFENMLGETANIRCKNIPYFQVFIIFDRLPYYKKKGTISKWETFSEHNMEKYINLSQDNIDTLLHTPNKTLIYVVHLPDPPKETKTQQEYIDYYRGHGNKLSLTVNKYKPLGTAVILNDYEQFIEKVFHTIKSI